MNKLLFFFCLLGVTAFAQTQPNISPADLNGMRAVGSPADPKVKEEWRKYHDHAQITDFCQRMVKAHPDLVKLQSIGKSFQGREMWLMTITDYKSGIPDRKPGFYIDGNIHGNEIQGGEIAMYTAWYLAENFYTMPFIRELLRNRVFYIIPSINLDGRENFIHNPNTASSSRSGMMPLDDDDDGIIDEDKLDDLDGDGNIVTMRRKNPLGRWKVDPTYPTRMVPARTDEAGEYDLLGSEGLDNDGDGQVNEDNWGTYDPNRDWAWNWQPNYVQNGALFYPGTLPETRNIKSFVLAHHNIAGAQSYHNNGGMFLRGPGAAEDDPFYSQGDIAVYDVIGKIGEKIVPGYKYFIIHKDLYTVYGGEIDWFALTRGVFTFSNELMTSFKLFNQQPNAQQNRFQNQDYEEFDKYLLMGDGYVQWKPFKHPQFGDVEIGGPKKNYLRNHPGFLLEEDAHRNMSFTLLHAYQMPQLEVFSIVKKPLANNLTEITATVYNSRIMPTHSAHDLKYKIERPDHISLKNATVVAGMIVENEDFNQTKEQKYTPQTIDVPNIPGMGFVKVRWIVSGKVDKVTVEVDSRKGGLISKTE